MADRVNLGIDNLLGRWEAEGQRRRDAQAIRVGKMFARAATRGNLFADTLCARMLRYVMTTGEVEQGALMKELHRIGGKATGFHFAFGRFGGQEGGSLLKRKPIPPKPNPDGTPRMRRVITWNSDINSWTRLGLRQSCGIVSLDMGERHGETRSLEPVTDTNPSRWHGQQG